MTKRTFSNEQYRAEVKKAYEAGKKFITYLWDGIEFEGLTIKRVYEVK